MLLIHSILVSVFAITVTQGTAVREYLPQELPQLVSDFELEEELLDHAGETITNSVVDGDVLVRITAPGGIVGTHDLIIYIDGRSVGSRTEVRFPYEFRWSFRGLLDGPHTMLLVFTNAEGKKGLINLDLTVQH